MSRESSPKIEDPKFADIFTLYQSIEGAELKKKRSYSCLTIALSLKDQMLIVSTQAHSLKGVFVCACVRTCQYKGIYACILTYTYISNVCILRYVCTFLSYMHVYTQHMYIHAYIQWHTWIDVHIFLCVQYL